MSHQLIYPSSVTGALSSSLPVGINPFWKLSFVFKCLTDSVVLDDFKTALDRLRAFKINRLGSFAVENGGNVQARSSDFAHSGVGQKGRNDAELPMPSPDCDELSEAGPWSNGRTNVTYPEASKRRNRGVSQITESSSEEVIRSMSDSPILRPQSSWLGDSGDDDYSRAVREVTRSSHSDATRPEREGGIGRVK